MTNQDRKRRQSRSLSAPVRHYSGHAVDLSHAELRLLRAGTRQEFVDAYQVRQAVESLAFRFAVPRVSCRQRSEVHRMCERMHVEATVGNTDRFREVDHEFHAMLVGASATRRLEEVHGHLVAQMGRLMKNSVELRGGLEESAAEHRAILAAFDCGDADLAARLIAGHIEVPQRVLEDLVARTIFQDEQPSNGEESSGLE